MAGCTRGATAVEFALVLPLLVAFLFGTMEYARIARLQATLEFAAQETARCLSVRPDVCGDDAAAARYLRARAAGLGEQARITIRRGQACGSAVEVETTHAFVLYALFTSRPRLRAQACRASFA
jgi:Flp pilus assembly protein TadG